MAELQGARLLVVEDEFLLLWDLESILREAGAASVQGARNVRAGLEAIKNGGLDAAVLDVRIGQESIAPVARALTARGTPFVFYTGQVGDDPALSEWRLRPILAKPATREAIVAAVAALLTG